jgi:hypothetical protein
MHCGNHDPAKDNERKDLKTIIIFFKIVNGTSSPSFQRDGFKVRVTQSFLLFRIRVWGMGYGVWPFLTSIGHCPFPIPDALFPISSTLQFEAPVRKAASEPIMSKG